MSVRSKVLQRAEVAVACSGPVSFRVWVGHAAVRRMGKLPLAVTCPVRFPERMPPPSVTMTSAGKFECRP